MENANSMILCYSIKCNLDCRGFLPLIGTFELEHRTYTLSHPQKIFFYLLFSLKVQTSECCTHEGRQVFLHGGTRCLYENCLTINCWEAERISNMYDILNGYCKSHTEIRFVFVQFLLFDLILLVIKKVNCVNIPSWCKCTTLHLTVMSHVCTGFG